MQKRCATGWTATSRHSSRCGPPAATASRAPGSCTSRVRSPRSPPEACSCSKCCSRARAGKDWIVNGALRTPLLVGAGGHFCPVARALGADLGRGESPVGAQEFEVRMTPEQARRSPVRGDTPQLYFCPDLAGYAWVVRKGDWLNVGIGRRGPRELAAHFERFLGVMVREGVLEPDLASTRAHGHA